MVIKTDLTKESMLEKIKCKETISSEFVLKHYYGSYPEYLIVLSNEFFDRFPNAIENIDHIPDNYSLFRNFDIGKILYGWVANASIHGHNHDLSIPIQIVRNYGLLGVLYEIHDKGSGFNLSEIFKKFLSGDPTYHRKISIGGGIHQSNQTDLVISSNDIGNNIYIMYLLGMEHKL